MIKGLPLTEQLQEYLDHGRVELRAGTAHQDFQYLLRRHGSTVSAIAADSVVDIGDVDNADTYGDLLSGESVGVAAAVVVFVVQLHDRQVVLERPGFFENAFADLGVELDELELLFIEWAALLQHRVWNSDLPDVVHLSANANDLDFPLWESHGFRN